MLDLEKQIGATWLDRRLVSPDTSSDIASAGFGQQMREAIDRHREHHIEHGDATRQKSDDLRAIQMGLVGLVA